jgi:hypothetical protein
MHINSPFQYDSLDKNNPRPQPQGPPKREWKVIAVFTLAVVFIVVIFIGALFVIHAQLSYIEQTSYDWQKNAAILFKWLLYTAPVVTIVITLYHAHTTIQYVTKRLGLINLMEVQTTIDQLTKLGIGYSYLDIWKERAKKSQFSGIQTLTWDNSGNASESDPFVEEKDIEEYLPPANNPILIELKNQGYIARSNNSILLGFGEKGK